MLKFYLLISILPQDLEGSLKEGELKRQEAINRLDAIKAILPKAKQGELEANRKTMEKEWQTLVTSIQQTQWVEKVFNTSDCLGGLEIMKEKK